MKRNITWKIIPLLACLILLIAIGMTMAYYLKTTSMDNDFETSKPKVYMNENFNIYDKWVSGEEKVKEVKFGNEGQVRSLMRVKFTPKLTLADGKTEFTGADIPEGFELVFSDAFKRQWTKGENGWYYYKFVLNPEAKTDVTLQSVKISNRIGNDVHGVHTDFQNAMFDVDIKAELVQARYGQEAAEENGWQLVPSVNGDSVMWN